MIKSRRTKWVGHVARLGEKRDVYRVLVGKHERKKPLGRPRRRWEDNIKVDLQAVECGKGHVLDRIASRWRQMAGTCEYRNKPSDSIKCGKFLDYLRTSYLVKKDSAAWSK